ncbi:MFS transporter [Lysobacter korlensis]|uniref:MFS transporter n=1 Tax=Lysobacter korlensis TaxID=553636 RepID=A0ABV6RT64_9GAMM
MFHSLRSFNYRLWFAGALVSNIGTWMQRTAQDWIVLTELTDHDAVAVGITMALQFVPQLLLLPWTGVIADTFNRRKLMLATQLSSAVLCLVLALLVLTGTVELWHVYVLATLLGVSAALDAPARQTFVAELVSDSKLPNAVALNSASFHGARLAGPAVAGLLIAFVGAGWVFAINGLTYGAVIAAILFMRVVELRAAPRAKRAKGQLRAGFRYVRSRSDIVVVLVMIFLMGTFGFNFAIFIATMSTVEFGRGAAEYGILSSVMAVGSLAGALLAARRERPRMRILVAAAAGFGFACTAAAFAPSFELFGLALTLVGVTSITLMTSANAYVQTTTPAMLRGRVMALYMAIFTGGTPIGAPLVGAVSNGLGPRWAIGVAAAAGIVAAAVAVVWVVRYRGVRVAYDRSARLRLRLRYQPPPRDPSGEPAAPPA